MIRLFNTYGRKMESFHPVNHEVVNIFTCGPSVYQRAHIGNFRTFLFEDIVVRYLEFLGWRVARGMNFTDVEDKAILEARKRGTNVGDMTDRNIDQFVDEMNLLRIKIPDYLARASGAIDAAVDIIETLLERGLAYWYKDNVYFDPLKFSDFGKLYGLDMTRWPKQRRRFHKDTYPGMRWNLGDFVLWDGCSEVGDYCSESRLGPGRPAWNIQDASIISQYIDETLSIYCGGIDNLIRHHDYSIAILESIRPYPMARYWLHCQHLFVNGHKMSKSRGNIYYTDTLLDEGYSPDEIRFFLIYGHYRTRINYTATGMRTASETLRVLKRDVAKIKRDAAAAHHAGDGTIAQHIREDFARHMDNDFNVKEAFDGIARIVSGAATSEINAGEASGIISVLKDVDSVLKVIF
jgi:cysteinyl-tRNA synthetase